MSKNPRRKLRKGPHGYLFVQIPSKMQYKYGLTKKDAAEVIDNGDGVLIKIHKNNLGERVYGEKDYNSTTEGVIPSVES